VVAGVTAIRASPAFEENNNQAAVPKAKKALSGTQARVAMEVVVMHRMRVHFCPQHWLLCHLGLY